MCKIKFWNPFGQKNWSKNHFSTSLVFKLAKNFLMRNFESLMRKWQGVVHFLLLILFKLNRFGVIKAQTTLCHRHWSHFQSSVDLNYFHNLSLNCQHGERQRQHCPQRWYYHWQEDCRSNRITDDDLWTPDNTSPEGLAMINFGVAAATFDCADSKGAQRPYEEATR